MSLLPPDRILIEHDDYHASHVGRMPDGRQVFLTRPFRPATAADPGCEFIALYLFDGEGRLLEARVDDLGPRGDLDPKVAEAAFDRRWAELGAVEPCRIQVQPFGVERYGTVFGLVSRAPEDDDEVDGWWVEAQPGNFMAFHEPWDSGEYDT